MVLHAQKRLSEIALLTKVETNKAAMYPPV